MPEVASMSAPPTGRRQRRMKNYLLDAHFQLKYSAYLVGIAVLFGVCLGTLLWRTSGAVIAQSAQTVAQGEAVVSRGREVVEESRKVSEVVKMNIVKDPIYSDNPALLEAYGLFGLVEMAIFVFILLLGLLYAWRKGVLRWL